MSGLKGRIIRLERRLPSGLEAELRAFSDEELDAEIAELEGVAVQELRAWTAEEEQRRMDELLAALAKDTERAGIVNRPE